MLCLPELSMAKVYENPMTRNSSYHLLWDHFALEKESVANSHEIRQTFRNASKAYYSYKYRTSVELIVGIALTGFFSFFSNIRGLGEVIFYLPYTRI